MCQQVSKQTPFDPNLNGFNHSSAVTFGPMFGSLLLTFCMTDVHNRAPSTSWKFCSFLRLFVNSLEIIFCMCEVLAVSLYIPASFTVRDVEWARCVFLVRWYRIGPPTQGLAESGWLGCNRSGTDGGVVRLTLSFKGPISGLVSSRFDGVSHIFRFRLCLPLKRWWALSKDTTTFHNLGERC